MKRIIFCFDGTWNKLAADTPTNVVLTAASIERITSDGTTQIIHYDEGVGTGNLEYLSGGMFGAGLVTNMREAYRFLIFNYDPGDEIFVFGFSRGAFTARTFVGLVRHVGPLSRLHVDKIDEAVGLYEDRLKGSAGTSDRMRKFRADFASNVCVGQDDDTWRCSNVQGYTAGASPPLTIRYLGVWDTVAALGVPANLPMSPWLNRRSAFHDAGLTDFVESGRHAIAIDERRSLFPVTTWGDLTELNAAKGSAVDAPKAPYQEKWFPGVHGSVGGGGDIRGLSDGSLAWVLKGAKVAGLRLDIGHGSRIQGFRPNPLVSLVNVEKPKFSVTQLAKTDRIGPSHLWQVSDAAVRRWKADPDKLPEKAAYRPKTLSKVKAALDALPPPTGTSGDILESYTVVANDSLSKLAKKYYGDMHLSGLIFDANRDQIDDPAEIFPGTILRIPVHVAADKIAETPAAPVVPILPE